MTSAAPGAPVARRPSRVATEWWLLTLVLLAVVLGLAHASREPTRQPLARIDAALYDLGVALAARPPRDEVLVVAIDDDSLAQVGRWPWRRAVTALLLERLQAGSPRAIGVDLVFAEPALGDERLAGAVAAGPAPVVLPVSRHRDLPLLPVPEIGAGRPLAHVEVPVDADGVIRGLYLREGGFDAMSHRLADPGAPRPDAQVAIAEALRTGRWERAGYVRIGAVATPVRQVSAAAVIRGEVGADVLRDRIVLVGATARGLGDTHATTVVRGDGPVAGVDVHAAAVSAMLDARIVHAPPQPLRLAAFALAIVALMAALYLTEPRTGLACVAVALVATAAASVAAVGAGLWVAPGALLVGLALAHPLWSWRRLHAASVGLIAQAARLEADAVPSAPRHPRPPIEPIARRLQRLEDAAERISELNHSLAAALSTLQAAQREREQTLRFLSHDLRAPHLSILSLLQRAADGTVSAEDARTIERQSRRALELTDGFMQLARAESQPLRREPHDLRDLSVEAADACWQRADARGLRISTPEPGAGGRDAVVPCDAQLVRRALINLLDNAMRVAPAGTSIDVEIEPVDEGWRVAVCDRGPGIAPADRGRIFEPWWRGDDADPSGGAGLGLAFVAAVLQRHGGRAQAVGRPGGGARIELWLPEGDAPGPSAVNSV